MNENNQPQSQQTKRELGYYHCRWLDEWVIARWNGSEWMHEGVKVVLIFDEIDERRIERKAQTWKEISIDGLPGEEYRTKWIEFIDMRSKFGEFTFESRLIIWAADINVGFFLSAFTHWRPIELPTK